VFGPPELRARMKEIAAAMTMLDRDRDP